MPYTQGLFRNWENSSTISLILMLKAGETGEIYLPCELAEKKLKHV